MAGLVTCIHPKQHFYLASGALCRPPWTLLWF